jgi:transcriptional regulator with XRE-family HTH domain
VARCGPGVGQTGEMSSGIGAHIKRLREERGWSQARLAREVCRAAGIEGEPITRHEVSRWERGARKPREWLPLLAAALAVPVEALSGPQTAEPPLPVLSDYLPADDPLEPLQRRSGGRIGASQVEALRQRVHGLRLADDVLAGGDLMRPALRELRKAVRLYREHTYSEKTGTQLLRQIGEFAQIAGLVASDAGQHTEAERTYRLGLSAATQAGDRTLAGHVAGSLAYQLTNNGRELEGLKLSRAALDGAGPDAPPKARALFLDRVAWSATKAGGSKNAQAAMRALGEAKEALSADTGEIESPNWAYWVNHGELQVMDARVYTELRRPLRAVPILREVLGQYEQSHTREMALYLSWLAIAYADGGEPEESAAVAERVISLSSDVASERTAERVRVVLARLAEYADVPEVRALLDSAA